MKIIVDAMGGDNAPSEIVKGAYLASQKYKSKIVLVGNKQKIEKCLSEIDADARLVDIVHTESEITMEDDPLSAVRQKKDSSMITGLQLLKEDGDAFVSAGNTGALHVGSSLIIRNIAGVQRSGIATIFPFERPVLMMDCGANVNVTSDYLVQWALMGQIYMNKILGVANPEVGLLNNGTEDHKGTQLQIDSYKKLKENEDVRFIGNVEGKALPMGPCDVLVTDGFTGNVTLKLVEGLSKYFFGYMKKMYTQNMMTKMSYVMMKNQLREMKHNFDASEYGGAPLLGLKKPVIKAHGSSDAKALCNAIRQAENFVRNDVVDEIRESMERYTQKKKETDEKTAKAVNSNE